jgi:hypothetical protein
LQGAGVANRELGAQFKADTNSVLCALMSFMTGMDFQGDNCRLVVIHKLPFPVPNGHRVPGPVCRRGPHGSSSGELPPDVHPGDACC